MSNIVATEGRSVEFVCDRDGCDQTRTVARSDYERRENHYCSPECSQNARKTRIEIVCDRDGCEEIRSISRYDYERHEYNYCSTDCGQIAKQSRVEIVCPICGTTKAVKQSKADGSTFCSVDCANEAKRHRQKDCEHCSTPFEGSFYDSYCSDVCEDEADRYRPTDERQLLYVLYVVEDRNVTDIARRWPGAYTTNQIRHRLKKYGIHQPSLQQRLLEMDRDEVDKHFSESARSENFRGDRAAAGGDD